MADLTLNVSSSGLTAGTNGDYGNIKIVDGGLLTNGEALEKGQILVSNGGVASNCSATNKSGYIGVSSGGKVYDMLVSTGRLWISGGGYASGAIVRGTSARLYLYDNAAYTFSSVRDPIIGSGADISAGTVTLRGINVSAYDFTMSNGTMNIQNGATIDRLTVKGGTVSMIFNTGGGNTDSGATVVTAKNVTVSTGATFSGVGAVGKNAAVSGLNVENGANVILRNIAVSLFSGNLMDGGAVSGGAVVSAAAGASVGRVALNSGASAGLANGAVASGASVLADGTLSVAGGATILDVSVAENGVLTLNGGTVKIGGGQTTIAVGTISGHAAAGVDAGVFGNMDWNLGVSGLSGITFKDNTIDANGSMYLQSGASAADITQNTGTFRIFAGASGSGLDTMAGNVYLYDSANQTGVARPDIKMEALRLSGGQAILRGVNARGSDFTVRGGKLYVQNGAVLTGLNVSNTGIVSMNYAGTGNVDYDATSAVVNDAVIHTGGNFYAGGNGIVVNGLEFTGSGYAYFSNGAAANGITNNTGSMYLYTGAAAYDLAQEAGTFRLFAGASGSGADVRNGNVYLYDSANQTGVARSAIKMEDLRLSGGQAVLRGTNASGSNFTVRGGTLHIQNGATLEGLTVSRGGSASMNYATGTGNVDYDATSITASRVIVSTGGSMTANGAGVVVNGLELDGGYFNVSSGADIRGLIVSSGRFWASNGGCVSGVDVISDRFYLYDNVAFTDVERAAIVGSDIRISGGSMVLRGVNAYADDITLYDGRLHVQNSALAENVAISGGKLHVRTQAGGNVDYDKDGATVRNASVFSGGIVEVESGGVLSGGVFASGASLTVFKHGQAGLDTVEAGAEINLSFWDVNEGADPGNADALITGWGNLSADATVNVAELEAAVGREYKVADSANANVTLNCLNCYRGVFDIVVKSGETASNAFQGIDYEFTDGKSITFSSFTVGTQANAAELDNTNATVLTDGGLATKWDSTTDVSTIPTAVAGANTAGNAWLTVDGANLATALYGAEGNFAHDVNLWLHEGTVRNLAAGATTGGSVKNVNLLLSENDEGADKLNFTGVAYAGGFGSVAGEVTAAVYGGTYDKDFYAGALANKLATNTTVGGIDLTVTDGKFKGNIYGASAVKTVNGTGSGIRNTTGDVMLTVTGGEATKSDFCLFAGGYATGTASGTVYTVDSINATIAGGDWGSAHGGRGIFGGIMASGVEAEVLGDVTITISGEATMGNVYGGGWAQKTGAKSIVGDVNINVAGGTIANVFGSGSHSTSGGTTESGDVTITVSGGDITGTIYARGKLDGDTTGSASVIFTGATDFGCAVFGYSYVGGAASDATLSFSGVSDELTGYTGTFSGSIGGFNSITFAGTTAMTLETAAGNVNNNAWVFDVSARGTTLADTAILTWESANFTSDTIALNLAEGAANEWALVSAAANTEYGTFVLRVDGEDVATGLHLGDAIAGTAYDGWGFALEDTVLKFKNLA